MSFFAIVFALLIEQVRPLLLTSPVHRGAFLWARGCARSLDAGKPSHGLIVWLAVVIVPALVAFGVHALLVHTLGWTGSMLAFAWHVLILYTTLGFRQFSHHFSAIRQALDAGDESKATELLAAWKRVDVQDIAPGQVLRLTMEYAVIASHRHVFGVLGWYAVLAALGLGPAGAVLYRMAEFASRYFAQESQEDVYASSLQAHDGDFSAITTASRMNSQAAQALAQNAWRFIDYIPARMTAIGFAIVGNFEEVVDAWRSGAMSETDLHNDSLIQIAMRAALSVKSELQAAHLQSLVGLVWRSVVLWLLLIALLRLANLFG